MQKPATYLCPVELLLGRWQSYQFTIRGSVTTCDHLLIKFEADGAVRYSHLFNGRWSADTIQRHYEEIEGKRYIMQDGRKMYEILAISQHELQLGAVENYTEPILVEYLKRLPNKP